MLKFTPQQVAENTIIDQIILETALGDQTISVNQFKGAVVVDPNLGNYVVIDFTVTDTTDMYIGRIRLMHGQTSVAISDDKQLLIVKEANKNLKIRLAAQFEGAEKCKFNTTSVNLPYATPFREGVVRFTNGDEINKSGTVYSAADVDAKINQVTSSLGNLDQYAKKAEENTFTENNIFEKNVEVNGIITGSAVATKGLANEKDTLVVSLGFANDKYLSKTDAGNTYLTQTDASDTYLKKTDAETAAGNYAKLDGGNTFTGAKNTFKEVSATRFSGDGVVDAITMNASQSNQHIPTDHAVKTYVDGKVETLNGNVKSLQEKDNDLQLQIDGINAGQNLADIVDTTDALAEYDISHLKAKDDFQHGSSGAKWAIGDKVQVLGDANVQSCVYELIKGTKPAEDKDSIQSTNNAAYYWRYIGVYGTNAYTKSEIDKQVDKINTDIGKKADKSYVDGKVGDINTALGNYVTLGTTQEITGAKTFANGNITIANKDNKTSHYVTIGSANTNDSGYKSCITHNDLTHNDFAEESFIRAGSGDNVSYTSSLSRYGTDKYMFGSKLEQHIGTHYKYTASDMYMTTGDPNVASPLPAAQIGTPGNIGLTDTSLTENYVERIRLRKNTSVAGDTDIEFLPAGQSVTDIDLFADNINNVFNNEVSFRVCTTSGEGVKTDKSVLKIHSSGVYYHTPEGNSISTTEYQLRTAGSLDFTTNMSALVGSDSYVPTTKAVADFVDNKITGITGGTAFVKTHAPNTNQTIESAITVTEGITVGSNEKPATLTVSGAITGSGVATQAIDPKQPNQVTTALAVTNFVAESRLATSNKDQVGAMGLFLYTGGDLQAMGAEVAGTSLQAVGMQLPMDGVVSWSQGAAMEGTWKLLNNTIAGEPCLVLAIRTA